VRTLLVFVLTLLPLVTALWALAGGRPPAPDLPRREGLGETPAVLLAGDLADAYGATPFRGELRRLEGMVVQLVGKEEGAEGGVVEHVRFYLAARRLGRFEGRPRFEEVLFARFLPPEEGRARLQFTLECPHAEGEGATLLAAQREGPRVVRIGGGVVARDPQGRPIAEIDSLLLDTDNDRVASEDAIVLRTPDRRATVRARGVDGRMRERTVTLAREVEAVVALRDAGASATFRCEGSATVTSSEDGTRVTITLTGGSTVIHPAGTARAPDIVALVERRDGEHRLVSAHLSGGVRLDPDPAVARGLGAIEAEALELDGEEVVRFPGPVRATRTGPVHPEFGLGDRRLDIAAGSLVLRLRARALAEARFERGVTAVDRDGAGHLEAGALLFEADARALGAWGGVEIRTPRGRLRADRLRIAEAGAGAEVRLLLEGEKRVEYDAEGRLGPRATGLKGRLALTCDGPLRLVRRGESTLLHAEDAARVSLGDASLSCDALSVEILGQRVGAIDARGAVRMLEGARGREVAGERLRFDGSVARLAGRPAIAREGESRDVRARELVLFADGVFRAEGEVRVSVALGSGAAPGPWKIACDFATGEVGGQGGPLCVLARGRVVADGPEGEHVEGDSFGYDGAEGRALLLGGPARLGRGGDLKVQSEGFDLRIVDGRPASARTRGPALLDFVPGKDRALSIGGKLSPSFSRWHVAIDGPCDVGGEVVRIPAGARLVAFGTKGEEALTARARSVVLTMRRTAEGVVPVRLEGGRGVEMVRLGRKPATVRARRFRYEAGSKEIELLGDGSVEGEGWASGARYERLVFVLHDEGVDLRRASRVAVDTTR